MRALMEPPPRSLVETVIDVLHGVPVRDPYRWLEDQQSPRTREWIAAQSRHARAYLDSVPGREEIRKRVRQLVDVESYDSLQKVSNRYFFRKRRVGEEQPSICFREGRSGEDQVLVDPALSGTGSHTAVKPLRVSPDGRLLLYEVKEGGERTGSFELLDINTHTTLPDRLPRGYLRGFAFAPDSSAFFYVHEPFEAGGRNGRSAYMHVLGSNSEDDREIFVAAEAEQDRLRLHLVPGFDRLGFLVVRFQPDTTISDFYLSPLARTDCPQPVIRSFPYKFGPILLEDGRILAITDQGAANFRIVEVRPGEQEPEFVDIVAAGDALIQGWKVTADRIFVRYLRRLRTEIDIFDLAGHRLGNLPIDSSHTVRLLPSADTRGDLFLEEESFTEPVHILSYHAGNAAPSLWAKRQIPFDSDAFAHEQVSYPSKDGTEVPIFLVGRKGVLAGGSHPTIMTAYGGYGVPMTPQFSVLVAFLIERGCLFALPNIRGGSEFGAQWHEAAKRRNRQVAFDDFFAAAEWLVATGKTEPEKVAIFGGSNSGLLVGAALTQRPELFCAVLCMVPMLDMLRYHLFDNAGVWKEEFGTAEDPKDFPALLAYSPYHNVRDKTAYPATMIVSGDADQNCNPMHARKMTARLQAANVPDNPIFLDYSRYRGHSPVLPLSERIEALTDRLVFLSDRLGVAV
jgi:prolyl oligopeptidase